MSIKFECPHCQRKLAVADAMAGKRGKCPACTKSLTVPSNGEVPSPPAPSAPSLRSSPSGNVNKGPSTPAPRPRTSTPKKDASPPFPPPKQNGSAKPTSPEPGAPPPVDAEAEAAEVLADKPPEKPVETEFIEFECDYCSEPIKLSVTECGKRSPCPSCRRIVKVPEIKKDKKDWRDTNSGLPAGARMPDAPPAEGTWGTNEKVGLTKETMEEAGLIPEKPQTVTQMITYWAVVVLLLGGLTWGGVATYSWWRGWGETNALQDAKGYAESKAGLALLGPERAAAIHIGALDFYCRSRTPGSADLAKQEFAKALSLLTSGENVSEERDFALVDLVLAGIELAGNAEEVDAGFRRKWDDVHKTIKTALKAIHNPEIRLTGLRQVGRRLLARDEAKRLFPLATDVFPAPELAEGLAEIGLELAQAGVEAQAKQACDQTLKLFENDNKAAVPAAAIALALLMKKPLPKSADKVMEDSKLLGESDAKARQGQRKEARDLVAAKAEGNSQFALHALVRFTAGGVAASPPDLTDLDKALTLAPTIPNKEAIMWDLFRLVELGIKGGVPEEKLQPLVDMIGTPNLRGRAQLDLLRNRLAKSSSVVPETDADKVGSPTSHAQARLALAEHNTRLDSSWAKVARGWPDPFKAFGSLGIALGMQPKPR
jgi:hypothetical protein